MDETQRGKYTFRVHIAANKLHGQGARSRSSSRSTSSTSPCSTTKAKEKSRNRKRGRVEGWTSPWKKAVVTLASGQKIEFFEGI